MKTSANITSILRKGKPMLALLPLFVWIFLASTVIPHKPKKGIKVIVIDAGHGGKDPGCNGSNEINEKAVTLSIALKLGKLIEDSLKDVKVIYTRKTDVFIELWERPQIANKNNADLFVSIHCNANNNTGAAGTETYVMGLHKTEGNLNVALRENESIKYEENYESNENYGGFDINSPESHIIFTLVQNAHLEQSLKFAQIVENSLKSSSKIVSRGVKQAGFLVLWKTTMPSVLIETGFLTNKSDRGVLKSEEGQNTLAQNIFKAIKIHKSIVETPVAPAPVKTTPAKTEAKPQGKVASKQK